MLKRLGKGSHLRDAAFLNVLINQQGAAAEESDEVNQVVRFPSGATAAEYYAKTVAGLTAACADASSGDLVQAPGCSLTSSTVLSVPAGVTLGGFSRTETNLNMPITLGNGSALESMTITRTASSASELTGVTGPDSGGARRLSIVRSRLPRAGAGMPRQSKQE